MIHLVLGAVIDPEPEPGSALDQNSCIGGAIGAQASGTESTAAGNGLGVAALIGEESRTIAYELTGNRIEVSGTAGILRSGVEVNVPLRSVEFERSQAL